MAIIWFTHFMLVLSIESLQKFLRVKFIVLEKIKNLQLQVIHEDYFKAEFFFTMKTTQTIKFEKIIYILNNLCFK